MDSQPVACVLVKHADGSACWEPLRDQRTNPKAGSYIVSDHRR